MPGWGSLLPLALRVGPQTVRLLRELGPGIVNNPELAKLSRELFERVRTAQRGRSRLERLRRTVEAVRVQATKLEAVTDDPANKAETARWVSHADSLLGAIDLLAVRTGARRRADLELLQQEADGLFAAVLEASVRRPNA